ncbi:MAG: PAS domain-containing protein [Proteobacteria bacterium]|nr:PAS domain-containing protein [Burkholderiales bacterium]
MTPEALDPCGSADRLRIATDAAELGIHEYDVASQRIIWDARVRRMWGVAEDLPITYDVFIDGVHADDRAAVNSAVEQSLLYHGSHRYDAEFRVVTPAGVERWIRATGHVRFDDRRPVCLIGTVQDIGRYKALEDALRAADKRKDEFLATLSHELRGPLAPLAMAAHVLSHPQLDRQRVAETAAIILRQTGRMTALLDDLLDVARVTSGKLELKRVRTSLSAIVEASLETARPKIAEHQHELILEMPGEPQPLDVDPLRMTQVFSNLLSNAAKYTNRGGRITVRSSQTHDSLVVSVSDNGIGLPAAALPMVFDLFSQVESSKVRSENGLGIGLALVKGLVELHGGTVSAHSAGAGQGSEFVVSLPLAHAESPDGGVPTGRGRG